MTLSQCTYMQVHVQGKQLDIAGVFYALALLHLPKLSMAQNFVHGVETVAELTVSIKRINDFLSLPEPPAPAHLQGGPPSGGSIQSMQPPSQVLLTAQAAYLHVKG